MLEFNIDISDALAFNHKLEERALKMAIRHAANKAIQRAYSAGARDLTKRYSLKRSSGDRPSISDQTELRKLTVRDILNGKTAQILAERKPISLIHTVVGPKLPRPQLGVPRKQRAPTYVAVKAGTRTRLRKSFIAQPATRKGGVQVFRYGGYKGKSQMLKQILPNVHSVLARDENEAKLTAAAMSRFDADFQERFAQEVEKLLAREMARL